MSRQLREFRRKPYETHSSWWNRADTGRSEPVAAHFQLRPLLNIAEYRAAKSPPRWVAGRSPAAGNAFPSRRGWAGGERFTPGTILFACIARPRDNQPIWPCGLCAENCHAIIGFLATAFRLRSVRDKFGDSCRRAYPANALRHRRDREGLGKNAVFSRRQIAGGGVGQQRHDRLRCRDAESAANHQRAP